MANFKKSIIDDLFNQLETELDGKFPEELDIQLENIRPGEDVVKEHNKMMNNIIQSYINSEDQHITLQRPVAIFLGILLLIQLLAFNTLVYFILISRSDLEYLTLVLDFLKYYISVVIVEILGMCLIVVKNIYKLSIGKMTEKIINDRNKK